MFIFHMRAELFNLIAMQMKSHLLFYVYYKLLWFYRDLRKKTRT